MLIDNVCGVKSLSINGRILKCVYGIPIYENDFKNFNDELKNDFMVDHEIIDDIEGIKLHKAFGSYLEEDFYDNILQLEFLDNIRFILILGFTPDQMQNDETLGQFKTRIHKFILENFGNFGDRPVELYCSVL